MDPARASRPDLGRCGLSVDVEDWFHAENMKNAVSREGWDVCDLRVERNTIRILDIMEAANARATFFVLGWVAERCPHLVRKIASAGHEVASHGHAHELVYSLTPAAFRNDVLRSKQNLEDLTGKAVHGYRAPCFSITEWALEILQEAGFTYDSSLFPTFAHDRYGRLGGIDTKQPVMALGCGLHEICVSCLQLGTKVFPWGGGGYFRLVPYAIWRRGVRTILHSGSPYVFYIHPWKIDPGQPRMTGVGLMQAFRHRVNLGRCEERFTEFAWSPLYELVPGRVEKKADLDSGKRALA